MLKKSKEIKRKVHFKVNYPFLFGLIALFVGSSILFFPLFNTYNTGESISLFSFALINFLGYLFFTMTLVEVLFGQLIVLGAKPILLISIAVSTAILSQTVDYLIGYFFSKSFLDKMFKRGKLEKYEERISKYGNATIFLFNLLPLSSPLLTLSAGIVRYDYRKVLLYSFLGLVIKYTVIAFVIVKYI